MKFEFGKIVDVLFWLVLPLIFSIGFSYFMFWLIHFIDAEFFNYFQPLFIPLSILIGLSGYSLAFGNDFEKIVASWKTDRKV